jgi:hypothetical protein
VNELDEQLARSLKRLAEPGNPTGVADAIRARVAAGDPGGSGPRRVPTGWRRVPRWLLAVAIAVIAIIVVGAGLFVSLAPVGTTASPSPHPSVPAPSNSPTTSPSVTSTATPTPTPSPQPTHGHGGGTRPTTPPHPTSDTTRPKVGPTTVQKADYCHLSQDLTNTVTSHATDNVGVTRMTLSWTGTTGSGSGTMTSAGHGTWTYKILGAASGQVIHVTVKARDAAGNIGKDTLDFVDGCTN